MILRIIAGIILLMVAWFVFWHVVGWLSLLLYLLAPMLLLAAIGYGVFLYMRRSSKASAPKVIKNFKLVNNGKQIYIFRDQPTVKDIVGLNNELHVAQLELSGGVFTVPEDTHVIVLEDTGKESVKIRIKGKKQKIDYEGWIDRSNLLAETKQITG